MKSSRPTTPYDESRPLLPDQQACESQQSVEATQTPLPEIQLAVLCSLRMLDPLAFTQIFPYVNQFMNDLRLTDDPSQVGFYSGLVESAFAISQLLAICPWAWISDIVGRRPVILAGATGLAMTTLLFGLSHNFASVLTTRFLAGLFSGNVAVIPSVLCEITDSSNQALAFPIFGLFWPIGAIVGPLIGGNFSNPVRKYPKLFDYEFLRRYPYFLPCVISSMVTAFGVIFGYFFLEETFRPMNLASQTKNPTSYGVTDNRDKFVDAGKAPSIKTLLSIPIIRALCASGCALSFISTAFDVVFVLFCYSPIRTGGLAFSVSQIGYSLATAGAIAASLQLFFMPTLLRRFNHAKIYKFCMGIWPFTFMALPALNIIARRGLDETTGFLDPWTTSILWIGIGLVLSMARVGFLAYSVNMLLVKEYSPSTSSLGSTMGLVQCCICFSRAFSPAFVSSAFAVSTNMNILGGYLWVFIMIVICLGGCSLSRHIVKAEDRQ